MEKNIKIAKRMLDDNKYTCVAYNGEDFLYSRERGVNPLLDFIDKGQSMNGYSVADRVVGRAAAFLYVKLEAKEVFAYVISRPAVEVLNSAGIPVEYEDCVDYIINRTGTGLCPMEESVLEIENPDEAEKRIRLKLVQLREES